MALRVRSGLPRVRTVLVSMTVLAAGSALVAQRPALPGGLQLPDAPERERDQPDQPTFRAEVTRVEVSVLVVDADGKPVRGLMASDFEVLESGKPQTIRSFTPFSYEPEQVVLPDPMLLRAAPDAATPSVTATNIYVSSSRVFALILDDLHIDVRRTQVARTAARRLVEQLEPADLLFVTTTGASHSTGFFSRDRARAFAMIDDLTGQRLLDKTMHGRRFPGLDVEAERLDNYRRLCERLRDVALALRDVSGRRKSVVLVTEGTSYGAGMSDMEVRMPTASSGGRVNAGSGSMRLMNDVLAAAAAANIAVYPLNPHGLDDPHADLIQTSGLVNAPLRPEDYSEILIEARQSKEMARDLAVLTGGVSLVDTNDPLEGMDRVVRDASQHYVLTYEPETPAKGSEYRRIDVRVNRPGVRVYARRGYSAPATRPPPPLKVPGSLSPQLRTLLSGVMPDDGLPMRVEVVPLGRKGRATNVAVIVEVSGALLTMMGDRDRPLEVEQGLLTVDERGRAANGTRRTFTLKLDATQWDVLGASGLRSVWTVDLPPGVHQVRVAAVDAAAARGGSVYLEIEIPRGDAQRPGVLVASRFLSLMPTVFVDGALKPWTAAGMPTATRVFPAGDELTLTVPHQAGGAPVTARLVDAADRVVWEGQGTAAPGGPPAAQVRVPLEGLDVDVCDLVVESSHGTTRTTIGILSPQTGTDR